MIFPCGWTDRLKEIVLPTTFKLPLNPNLNVSSILSVCTYL